MGRNARLRASHYAVAISARTQFERKLVGRLGLEPADGSDLWFKAHPKEEPMNHSLAAVRHRARRARVTQDHRIKSPTVSLLTTTIYNTESTTTTSNPLSFNALIDSCFTGGSWLELRLVEHECPTSVPRANRPRTPPAAPGSGGGPSQAALAYGLARWYDDRGDPDRARQAYRRIVSEAPWAAFGAIAAETELANLSDAENPVW